MSLLFYGRRIRQAIAGELPAVREHALRRHLRRCVACRDRYDRLSVLASPLHVAARERARLEAQLVPSPIGKRARPRRLLWAVALLPAAAGVLLLLRSQQAPRVNEPEITFRGAATDEARPAAPVLAIYASRKGEDGRIDPLRLVAEMPASGEAVVSIRDYIQLACRGGPVQGHLVVFGRDAFGVLHQLFPTSDGKTRVEVDDAMVVPVGKTIDLADGYRVGPLRLHGVWSTESLEVSRIHAALEAANGDGGVDARFDAPAVVLDGILQIEP